MLIEFGRKGTTFIANNRDFMLLFYNAAEKKYSKKDK